MRPHLLGPHASGLGLCVPPYRRFSGELRHGPHDQPDLSSLRCRQTLRGHVDSVNACAWQPFSNNICTASGDKTVSIWDAGSALRAQTFYGHTNARNGVACNARGDVAASCDADGVVKLWDVRRSRDRHHTRQHASGQ